MGYVLAFGPCFICRVPFSYNPVTVPSLRDALGQKQPICLSCMTFVNKKREASGMPPHPIAADAYEAAAEARLDE